MVKHNIKEVIAEINSKFAEEVRIISVDGWTGAGKTTLTNSITGIEDLEIIEFDKFFEKNAGLYLEVFNFDGLEDTITKALESNKKLLLDGICMNEILNEISIESDYKVYIKELGVLEDWYYEKYLDETKSIEEIFTEDDKELETDIFENSEASSESKPKEVDELSKQRKGVFYDLVRYHREYKPQENSDLIFERLNENA